MPPKGTTGAPVIIDGALMKRTTTGKDKCHVGICTRKPVVVITDPFGKKVWVCRGHG